MRKRLFGFLISAVLMVSMCMPVMAAPVADTSSPVTDTSSHDSGGVPVKAVMSTGYTVHVPAEINLLVVDNNQYAGTYDITVTGAVASNKWVEVVPKTPTFTLSDTTPGSSKTATASITLGTGTTPMWSYDATKAGSVKLGQSISGKVEVTITDDGTYEGTAYFTYGLKQ